MKNFIFTWNDGKRLVIESDNLLNAQEAVVDFLKSKGLDPMLAYTAKQTIEGDAKRVAERENKALAGNIQQARQEVLDKESEERPWYKTLARGVLSLTNPFLTEVYESGNEDDLSANIVGNALDLGNALTFGGFGVASKAVMGTGKMATPMAKKVLNALRSKASKELMLNVGSDIIQQESLYGELDKTRTGLATILGAAPNIGKAKPILEEGARRTAHSIILPSAVTQKFGGLDYDKMLSERIFSGFGKYSGIEKLNAKMQPLFDVMDKAREGGAVVDMKEAKRQALEMVDNDKGFTALQAKQVKAQIENVFNAEMEKVRTVIPEIREAVPNKKYDVAMTTAENEAKAKATRENKKIDKLVENMRASGRSEEYIAKVTGQKELDPIIDVGLGQMPYKKPSDFFGLEEAKELANTFDPWEIITTRPQKLSYDTPLADAMNAKTAMQHEGFRTTSDNTLADAYRVGSGALLKGIKAESPEAVEAMAQLSPYMAMASEMERRKSVGGSNSIIPLKQLLALYAGGIPTWALSYIPGSLKGAQTIWDFAQVTPQLGKILGMTKAQATRMGGDDE